METTLLQEATDASIDLLRRNLRPEGILAATPGPDAEARRYARVFGRDAAICALGMVASGDRELTDGAERSLCTLASHQAENGQIPKFVDGDRADFWYVGCIDATLWWLIAVEYVSRRSAPELRERLSGEVRRALTWLACHEHPQHRLLYQNEASDWADIYPRAGFVLYSNALWYCVKRIYGLPQEEATRRTFNAVFHPFQAPYAEDRRLRMLQHYACRNAVDDGLYLSCVDLGDAGREGDVFGNLLAVLCGLAGDSGAQRVVDSLGGQQVDLPWPAPAVCKPINPGEERWRQYMGRHRQNLPWQYHNGGVWPFIGGFWVLALVRLGRFTQARAALLALAEANRADGWGFREWFDGRSGAACGMRGQSWNAAMFLLARHVLEAPGPRAPEFWS